MFSVGKQSISKALFCNYFEMLKVASLILDGGEQIKLLQIIMAIASILLNKSISR